LCYKFTGCANLNIKGSSQQIDTLSVIENKNNTIVNVNDCPYQLAHQTLKIIKNHHKNIDILLTGYGGAGPYPQCFDNLSYKEKIIDLLNCNSSESTTTTNEGGTSKTNRLTNHIIRQH
jgi:UDP-MurNAc hydroxylase